MGMHRSLLCFFVLSSLTAIQGLVIEDEFGSIILNEKCAETAGKVHTLVQPSFPSSGRGWTQKLIFLALGNGGIGKMNNSNFFKFGYKSFPISSNISETNVMKKMEWIFSHEGDSESEARMQSTLIHPERPQLVFRVIRGALDNIEANYRYIKKEGGNTGNWDTFASEKIQRYRRFHQYWDNRCAGTGEDTPCCMSITYEDMQNEKFLRRALEKMLELWLTPALSPSKITKGVNAAVNAVPPKHSNELLFPSGKRFSPYHHVALVSSRTISSH
jgi:hypothetical protein